MTGFMAPVILNCRFDLKKSNSVNILIATQARIESLGSLEKIKHLHPEVSFPKY
jgi:hypothetical protein